jgi:hypothetical protein
MGVAPEEVFRRHVAALTTGDVDAVVADYAEDAVVLTATGEYRGRAAVRDLIAGLVEALPDVTLKATHVAFADDALFLQWTADSTVNRVTDGVDTFIFADGQIRLQTISCTLTPAR